MTELYSLAFDSKGTAWVVYDSYKNEPATTPLKRATRWGYYGMTHSGPWALLGEIAAGTDEGEPLAPGTVTGPKTNLIAYLKTL